MKKRVFSILLALCMVLTMLPVTAGAADSLSEGLKYSINGDTVTITGYTGSATELAIPATIEGKSVTTIGASAFKGCTHLTSITIPDSVTTIGSYAFYDCAALTGITIPDGVTAIDSATFWGCASLTSVTIPDSVTTIGSCAFSDCTNLVSVTIGDSVTTIGGSAFSGCTSLTSITIPDGVTTIDQDAFHNCTSLTSITIPDSVTSIGFEAFGECTNLTSVAIGNSVTTIGSRAFRDCARLTSITIPDNVTTIGSDAFYNCTGLTSVTIGNSVTTIGGSAFEGCTHLTSITIPDSVTSIGSYAFYNCDGLTSITIPDSVTTIGKDAFYGCSIKKLIIADGSETVTSTMVVCESTLEDVVIPASVTTIGDYAFGGCDGLKSITIPDGVTTIGEEAFYGCDGLTSITIPDGVTTIGEEAFYGCGGLASVTIGDSVMTIGSRAFQSCGGLTSVTIGDSVMTIDYCAFYGCDVLTSVTIPASVTTIGDYAFGRCTSLTSVTFTGNLPTIGKDCFATTSTTAYYPCNNDTWTDAAVQELAGTHTSVAWKVNHTAKPITGYGATCMDDGLTDGVQCDVCKEWLTPQQPITAPGHTPKPVAGYGATCTDDGLTDGVQCSVCEDWITPQQPITAPGHDYVNGTCTECGEADPTLMTLEVTIDYMGANDKYTTSKQSYMVSVGSTYQQLYDVLQFPVASEHTSKMGALVKWNLGGGKAMTDKIVPDGNNSAWNRIYFQAEYEYEPIIYTVYYLDKFGEMTSQHADTRMPWGCTEKELLNSLDIPDCGYTLSHWLVMGKGDMYYNSITAYACYDGCYPLSLSVSCTTETGETLTKKQFIYINTLDETAAKNAILQEIRAMEDLFPTGTKIAESSFDALNLSHQTYDGNDHGTICFGLSANVSVAREVCVHNYVNGICTECGASDPDYEPPVFADIPADSWQYPFAQYAVENGLMAGKGTDEAGNIKFDPNSPIKREEFVQVLYNAEGKPTVTIPNIFPDVAAGGWYKNAVLWAKQNDIASGKGNGNFGVGENISRQDLAMMLYKYAKLNGYSLNAVNGLVDAYADGAMVADYARGAMNWAVTNGIMSGKGAAGAPLNSVRLDPTGIATRAECAAMLKNFRTAFGG